MTNPNPDTLREVIAAATDCIDCEGTGLALMGWTDKGGVPENQYGPCPHCERIATAVAECLNG